MVKTERERVAQVARMYRTSTEASEALGIAVGSFCRLCRTYGIETPVARRRNRNGGGQGGAQGSL